MTEKELSNYYYLKIELKDLEERIAALGNGVGAIKYSDGIKGIGGKINTLQERISELKDLYLEKRVSALEEYIKIEKYISDIEDSEIRTIMRYRFLDLMNWEKIGDKLGMDRTTAMRTLRRYLRYEVAHNAHVNMR